LLSISRKNELQKLLLVSLISTGLAILVSTFLGKEIVKSVTDVMYILATSVFVALSVILVLRFKKTGDHGKAWLFLLGTSVSWFLAETTWTVYELIYNKNPFPSIADVFYVSGYPLMFGFLIYYLKPVRKAITKKMMTGAILISASIAIPSIYMAYSPEPDVTLFENVLATSYPILDSIIFIPAIIGIALFFRGEVNFTWSLICIGILCFAIGDIGFQYATFTNTYYTGHPVDIILIWSYVFYAFGVYDHVKIFGRNRITKSNKLE
jgi:hypothetical protein